MIKNLFKSFISIFIITTTLTTTFTSNAFALVDRLMTTNYNVTTDDSGKRIFHSSLSGLGVLPNFPSFSFEGDLGIELNNPFCIAYTAAYFAVMYAGDTAVRLAASATLVAMAGVIYAVAQTTYKNYEICGADWLVWGNSNTDVDAAALKDIYNFYPEKADFGGSVKESVLACNADINKCDPDRIDKSFLKGRDYLTINDKAYREKLYDGMEIVNEGCIDPRKEAKNYDVNIGKTTPHQLYYMRGYDKGNYACERFLIYKTRDGDEFDEAYQCCREASKSVCIRNKASITNRFKGTFCSINSKLCIVDGITLEIVQGLGNPGKYCARTYSLCPYNFNIQKGSEFQMQFEKKSVIKNNGDISVKDECYNTSTDEALSCQGEIKNFYQYNRHCTIVEEYPETQFIDLASYSPFVDKSCINLVGSSHNTDMYASYDGYQRIPETYKSFTAPMVECFSETLKNFLTNTAGHTRCEGNLKGGNDILPDSNEDCSKKGGAVYTRGEDLFKVKGLKSPTLQLLETLHSIIMLVLTIMIVLFGYGILVNSVKFDRKTLLLMLIKVTIVISFSASDWWYKQLYLFTYSFSNTMSAITAKFGFDETKDKAGNYIKYDGCYFGNINDLLTDKENHLNALPEGEDNNYWDYPANRKYMAFFDSLDCKLNKYLGVSFWSSGKEYRLLEILAVSLIWPFNIGIFLAVATFMLFFFVVNFALKAIYIFAGSSIAMTVMLYISPMIIPCILFKRTKGVFDKWLKNLISFALQPMVLFLYVGIAITILDKYALDQGIYTGHGTSRELVCGYSCVDKSGVVLAYTKDRGKDAKQKFLDSCKNGTGEDDELTVVDLKRNSPLCFLKNMTTNDWTLFKSLGLFIPLLVDVVYSDVISFLRLAFLFFILTQGLSVIPGIAANLTTGKALPKTGHGNPFDIAKKVFDFSKVLSKGTRSTLKKIKDAGKKEEEEAKEKKEAGETRKGGEQESDQPSIASVKTNNEENK